ncbi:hypothetical protein BJ878DRAFT_558874 [Calycina marina]|uniref:Uncharacterized protein n=1 Tax=Calycina marina TaxID=1763456 RepID=A0A9P8CC10_9HELO|nr:hypothetical protein BJ878DRAFT_558874 [Calycina marina]
MSDGAMLFFNGVILAFKRKKDPQHRIFLSCIILVTLPYFLLPQLLQKEGETRQVAKGRFANWMGLGRTCSRLANELGAGIFLLLPRDIPDETKKLTLEVLSEHDMESRAQAGGSLQDLYEFSDKINYTSFLTDDALSTLYPPSPETPACSVARWQPAGDDTSVLLDTHVYDSPDQSIPYDAEHLEGGKSMERFNEDFFLVEIE